MRSGRSKTRSATPLPCEQLLGQEPRDDRSRRAIPTKCPEPVFRTLLDIGGPQGVRFERAATDSHKLGRWQNAPRGRRAQGCVSPEGPSLGRCIASCLPRAQSGQESLQRLREVDDHREGYNHLGHEQVHPDRLVADNIVEAFKHDPLLETILPQAVSRPTNVLQPY
jgi:hypothetical protein